MLKQETASVVVAILMASQKPSMFITLMAYQKLCVTEQLELVKMYTFSDVRSFAFHPLNAEGALALSLVSGFCLARDCD